MEERLEEYFDKLWPICRSITGDGLRESFKILQEIIPLQLEEVPTGTEVFDWSVPKEWNIKEAYIITPAGEKICDFKTNNLHVLNYSVPVNKELSYTELQEHLFSLPDQPEAVPYVTSYYRETWGFCIAENQREKLPKEGTYRVFIDSTLEEGSLTYGDLVLKGKSEKEILFSSYLCHPSMANNELSGPLALAFLYELITSIPDRKFTYRFVIAPETIGVITYLAKHGEVMKQNTIGGLVLTCCGDSGDFVYKMSKQENSIMDQEAQRVLRSGSTPHSVVPFAVGGSDERQYCSPGFDLPVGSITRSMYQRYKEYHTSLDNKSFISFSALKETVNACFSIVKTIENSDWYKSTVPYCEPFMQKYNLYSHIGGTNHKEKVAHLHRRMHMLSFADGKHSLETIAGKRNESVSDYEVVVKELLSAGLIKRIED